MAKSSKSSGSGEKGRKAKDKELVALGKRLGKARKSEGLTQEALAEASGLHWTYVGQVERGERNPTYKNILKLARGLGVEPSELMPSR
jgi:transcriptional regulator with XRE-family HTH domain